MTDTLIYVTLAPGLTQICCLTSLKTLTREYALAYFFTESVKGKKGFLKLAPGRQLGGAPT
jgi:hypothetical protein